MAPRHLERHRVGRLGWLRAAVLGANDGLLSTSSLIIGVAAASTDRSAIVIAGAAGLFAGALSMAAGEYVSVSSQYDSEQADLRREREELRTDAAAEQKELAGIYVERGLSLALAQEVATQLMARDALGAHARDELGLSEATAAKPLQAALASAAAFAAGACGPLGIAMVAPPTWIGDAIAATSLILLMVLGAIGAKIGGARIPAAVVRVTLWGALAMAVTAGLGRAFGASI